LRLQPLPAARRLRFPAKRRITEVTPYLPVGHIFGVKSVPDRPFGDVMKRIAALMLLAVLSLASSMPAQAQRISPQENARQSRKAIKKQQKMLNKANKKQAKAMKKAAKTQRKATKKANKRYKK
jgi:hypothetical protein